MIDIFSSRGELYRFDESSQIIYKDGFVVPKSEAEPVFGGNGFEDTVPEFSGIWIKATNSILTRSGKINPITDPNTLG